MQAYAFGVLMWELVSHSPPWASLRQEEVYTQVVDGERPRVDEDRIGISGWKDLMEQCWHRTPEQRPSMSSVCDQLSTMKHLYEREQIRPRTPDLSPMNQQLRKRQRVRHTVVLDNAGSWKDELAVPLIDLDEVEHSRSTL